MNGSERFRSTSGLSGCYGNVISPENKNQPLRSFASSQLNISENTAATPSNICFIMPERGHVKARKHQTPITKHQRSSNHQSSRVDPSPDGYLELGFWLFSRVWCLGFGASGISPFVSARRLT